MKRIIGQERIELLLRLGETTTIDRVDEVDYTVDGGEVILPETTGRFVSAKVECFEFDFSNDELVGVGVESGDVDLDAVFFEHVEEGGFPGVVEAEEEDLGVLVVESC